MTAATENEMSQEVAIKVVGTLAHWAPTDAEVEKARIAALKRALSVLGDG